MVKKACMAGVRSAAIGLLVVMAGTGSARAEGTNRNWKASVNVGFNLTSGNSDALLATVGILGVRETEKVRLHLGVEGAYGETEVEDGEGRERHRTTRENAIGSAGVKRRFNKTYVLSHTRAVYDDIALIDYRLIAGVGLGRFFLESAVSRFSADAGVGYLWERVDASRDRYVALRLSERYSTAISDTARVWQSAEVVPKAEDLGDYLLNAEVGIETAIAPGVNWRTVVRDRYDSEPGAAEKNDLVLIAALTWLL